MRPPIRSRGESPLQGCRLGALSLWPMWAVDVSDEEREAGSNRGQYSTLILQFVSLNVPRFGDCGVAWRRRSALAGKELSWGRGRKVDKFIVVSVV